MKHSIRFENDALFFSSSHFITFGDPEKVEALHGHNFRVKAEVTGPLNDKQYVIDFIVAFDILKRICDVLSHKVLLPQEHPYIKFKAEENAVRVTMPPLRWTFPKDDTLVLPVKNTTTEAIAQYVLEMFRQALEEEKAFEHSPSLYRITIALEESPGMWAIVRE